MMTTSTSPVRRAPQRAAAQRGSFLLEALIAVLIVALAILGLLGLMARGMQDVDESKQRGEAALLAASYIGNMWVDDRKIASLQAKYKAGGAAYNDLAAMVAQKLPNGQLFNVDVAAGATANSADVEIEIRWTPPGLKVADTPQGWHRYQAFATIGAN
ncbi:MAG TPA: hypothetical protein VLR71_20025 [Casimicrobiaceae bacterium]|nr:hypothetical protein [Casimicrobiaceae bacterium]